MIVPCYRLTGSLTPARQVAELAKFEPDALPGSGVAAMTFTVVNTENFRKLREEGGYYVDKTGFLEQMYEDRLEAVLFTRPRRFGKTLFMSMLAEFFDITKDSREIFAGLDVSANEKLCQEWMNGHPVISLTFRGLEFSDYDKMVGGIGDLLREFVQHHVSLLTSERVLEADKDDIKKILKEKANENTLKRALGILTRAFTCHYGKKTVLLIDEYDVLLEKAETAEVSYYDQALPFMRSFLAGGLKTNAENLKLGVLTGVLRIARQSIFSELNNMECYDIDSDAYSELFGFTRKEVEALLANAGFEKKGECIREWYDGYRFGIGNEIYNPWSIMMYLKALKSNPSATPSAFWVDTGKNSLPRDFVSRLSPEADVQGKIAALNAGHGIAVYLNTKMNYDLLYASVDNFWTLLYLTGYLTRAGDPAVCPEDWDEGESVLVIPNKEIRSVFMREVKTWIGGFLSDNGRVRLYNALWEQDAQVCEDILNDMLAHDGLHEQKEIYYHGMVKGAFDMRYPETTSSGQGGKGFYDLLVPDRAKSRAAVIEFKRASSEKTMGSFAEKALKQIEERAYDARVRAEGCKTILHVGIAFHGIKARVLFKDASPGKERA